MKKILFVAAVACLPLVACASDPVAPLALDAGGDATSDMVDMSSRPGDQGGVGADDMNRVPDAGSLDQGSPIDQGTTPEEMGASTQDMADMSMMIEDAPVDMPDNTDMGGADMPDGADMGDTDMGSVPVDMGASPYADRARGDCTRTSDCGSPDLFCERGAVGGTCYGSCNACDDLPGSNTYQCIAGACVPECGEDADCPPGRFCNTRRGVCQVEQCTNNVCPVPWFGCSEPDGICVRVACDGGQACPAGTQCDGSYCIEDHSVMP